jgi:limonene-1,2-epoxide hydrolase
VSAAANRTRAEELWETLYRRDFAGVGAMFAADGEYTDMPTPPEDLARGPEQIAARLALGLEPLASIGHTIRAMVSEGNIVVTEHVEHWEWPSGERADLPFVSVQELRDGQFVRWHDYFDLSTLLSAAPSWWLDHVMAGSVEIGLRAPD